MKFSLTHEQRDIVEAATGTATRAASRAADGDPALVLEALRDGGFLDLAIDIGPLEAALVTEAASAAGTVAPIGARLLVAPAAGVGSESMVGLVDGRSSIVRFGADADMFIGVDRGSAFVAHRGQVTVAPLAKSIGTPAARVEVHESTPLDPKRAAAVQRRWRIAIAAEAAGAMRAAVDLTVPYVSQRIAFGRPLGAFQAVQHRLARAEVHARGTSWLARHAAWDDGNDYLAAAAATYACVAAVQLYENTHQVTGGIGITTEHGLARHTLRLVGLQRELGGRNAHARRATASRRDQTRSALEVDHVA